jgi:hypothetical protein
MSRRTLSYAICFNRFGIGRLAGSRKKATGVRIGIYFFTFSYTLPLCSSKKPNKIWFFARSKGPKIGPEQIAKIPEVPV